MEKMNAGFVIEKEEIYEVGADGCYGIALGYRTGSREEWVTWGFTEKDGDISYYWGHYYEDWASAFKDYHDRLAREYARMEE